MDTAERYEAGHRRQDKPLAQLMSELSRETSDLVHGEVQLAKAELSRKVDQAASGAAAIGVGSFIAFAGFLVLLDALVLLLAPLFDPESVWLAPLFVGGTVLIVGLIFLFSGRERLQRQSLAPERTIRSVERDRDLAREKLS